MILKKYIYYIFEIQHVFHFIFRILDKALFGPRKIQWDIWNLFSNSRSRPKL